MTSVATAAVPVFFVLSGFVIRYVTLTRYNSLRRYTIDRASRMYSVVLPALALTVLLDGLSRTINRPFYMGNWGPFAGHAFARIALNATFLAQSWFRDYAPLSNSPFWSLSYECAYYAFYGFFFYLTGKKRILGLAMVFALSGLPILLLMPAWLLGCVTFDVYSAGRFNLRSALQFLGLSSLIIAVEILRQYGLHHLDFGWRMAHSLIVQGYVSIPTALVMLCGSWLLKNYPVKQQHTLVRSIRWFANSTFVLYLIHFPLMVLIASAIPYNRKSATAQLLLAAVVVLIAASVTGLTDRLKNAMRSSLLRVWPQPDSQKFVSQHDEDLRPVGISSKTSNAQ